MGVGVGPWVLCWGSIAVRGAAGVAVGEWVFMVVKEPSQRPKPSLRRSTVEKGVNWACIAPRRACRSTASFGRKAGPASFPRSGQKR